MSKEEIMKKRNYRNIIFAISTITARALAATGCAGGAGGIVSVEPTDYEVTPAATAKCVQIESAPM